jgi:alkanesulfonate monooxygenase SsuD/methylene tetrahydromethanopterin reductase-like flavin-dependent oxidoreductase (luciferase family)
MPVIPDAPEASELHLAVALDGAGWHPAAWREPSARPGKVFDPSYWADLAGEAEAGNLDFLTIEDSLGIQSAGQLGGTGGVPPGGRAGCAPDTMADFAIGRASGGPDHLTNQVRGRLDAVLIAARIAPLTTHIGLVPTAVTTHTEPFHLSTALATLDYASEGRAGWRARVSSSGAEARHFGRRSLPRLTLDSLSDPAIAAQLSAIFDEGADAVEVVRRLWDSWG